MKHDNKILILVRTRYDNPTMISYNWANEVKEQFDKSDWEVIDLSEEMANILVIEPILREHSHALFMFYGHGMPDHIIGQNQSPLIGLSNVDLLSNKRVYSVACWSAQKLGPASINLAHCFLGFDSPVFAPTIRKYAKYFGICINSGILSFLVDQQNTFEDAKQIIIDQINSFVDQIELSDDQIDQKMEEDPYDPQIFDIFFLSDLVDLKNGIRLFGDSSIP